MAYTIAIVPRQETITIEPRTATITCEVDAMNRLSVVPDQVMSLGGGGLRSFSPSGDAYLAAALRISGILQALMCNDQNSGGTTMLDQSGGGRNAVSEQVIYNHAGVAVKSVAMNGKTGYINLYSSSLDAALDVNECTFAFWIKTPTVGVWGDATIRNLLRIQNAGGNALDVRKTATANQLQVNLWCSPTNLIKLVTITPSTNWLHICVTISRSSNRMIVYVDGVAQTPTTGLNTAWSGALTSTAVLFGALSQSNQQVWNGLADNLLIYGRELTAAEVSSLATWTPVTETRQSYMGVGDSKTWGQNDSTATFANGNNGWIKSLADTTALIEVPRNGVAGRTWATAAAAVDAELLVYAYTPNYIFVNFGANDVLSLPSQATLEANIAYVLDAYHAKFPSATLYVDYPWRSGTDAACNTLAGYIDNVRGSRAWALAGLDERTTLKGADNGATYYSDGVHPNAAGHAYWAALRKAALGL